MSSKQRHLKDQGLGRCIWLTALIAIIAFIGILVTIDYLPDHGMPDPDPIPSVTPSPTPHELLKNEDTKSTV
jgi:hypothetical protein